MKIIENLRVHVAPVGFEIDRIVLPAKNMKADRVYLLVHDNPSLDKATKFYDRIEKSLKEANIETVRESHDRLDMFKIIKSVKTIAEKEKGNTIYINLASGSKIQSIASMIASMMFNDDANIHPFYVEAEKYVGFSDKAISSEKPISSGIKEIQSVPTYEIRKPAQRHIDALQIVVESEGRLSKKEMARIAKERRLITVNATNESQATFASLDKNIIRPLEDQWKFIKVEKIGRNRWIQVTEHGQNAAKFLL